MDGQDIQIPLLQGGCPPPPQAPRPAHPQRPRPSAVLAATSSAQMCRRANFGGQAGCPGLPPARKEGFLEEEEQRKLAGGGVAGDGSDPKMSWGKAR